MPRLDDEPRIRVPGAFATPVDSAVLAPAYRDAEGRLRLILVRRGPGGIHGGQLGFPGGRREPEDETLLATALREAQEEVGLDPETVQVVASLPVLDTISTGFRIAPFLGRLAAVPPVWRRQESEIAEVLDVAVDELLRPEAYGEEVWKYEHWPGPRLVPFYRVGDHKLWGATFNIVRPLLPRLASGEWDV